MKPINSFSRCCNRCRLPLILAIVAVLASSGSAMDLPGMSTVTELILKFDSNGDGSLDKSEFQAAVSNSFDEMDKDGDNKITEAEIEGLSAPIGEEYGVITTTAAVFTIKTILLTLDKNGDRVLSKVEYEEGCNAYFIKLDANRNGSLSRDEIMKWPTQMFSAKNASAAPASTVTRSQRADPLPIYQPKVKLVNDSIPEPEALNFARGEFGTCINGQTFQIEAVASFKGWQYATCFDGSKRLCVARRRLPAGPWQRIAFDDYKINHTDVHNVPVIGICAADGTIHLAFDHHCSSLHYRVSRAGAATSPDKTQWTAALFGPTTAELAKGAKLSRVTYPAFVSTPAGRLLFFCRIGSSGDGSNHLAHYDPDKGGWTALGEFISSASDYRGSTTRNAYHNGFDHGPQDRLHTTWVWREGMDNRQWGLLNCHDLQYAYSDDGGRCWRNNNGEVIGTTGQKPMHLSSPEITVREVPWRWGIMNQVTQTVDNRGRVHVVLWQNPPDAPAAAKDKNDWRYFHYWRDEQGRWRQQRLPVFGRKPSVVADKHDNLVLIYIKPENLEYHGTDPGGLLHIAVATAAQKWTDWRELYQSKKSFVGEPRLDKSRWQQEAVLSIYAQEAPDEQGKPSALRVMDFRYE